MFDILKAGLPGINPADFGYEKLYVLEEIRKNIIVCENLAGAATNRNKKALIMVRELDFDLGSLKLLAEKKKACLLFDLSKIINARSIRRTIEISKMRTSLKYCNKYGVFYTFATFAENEPGIRNSHELLSICLLLGINPGQARFALGMIKHYIEIATI